MKESKAKEWFETWWGSHGMGRDKDLAWEAFKKGVKIAEIFYIGDEDER